MKKLVFLTCAAMVAAPMVMTTPAMAEPRYDDGYRYNGQSREYRGHDREYRRHCGGGNGAVGTVVGGAGGAVLGSALGGGTLGTVAGGVGGALLGRHLDKKNTRDKNDC